VTPMPWGQKILARTPRIGLHLEPGRVVVEAGGRRTSLDAVALRVLDAFATPRSVDDALAALAGAASPAQWMRLTDVILALHRLGVLIEPGDGAPAPLTGGFGGAAVHIRMLNDTVRTERYLDAIARTVRPGDVVGDIGTGTGILAMAAARAGARRVFAIEASSIADSAEALFRANGFADRIQLIRGWSTEVELPERANVMVAELIGVDPLGEQVFELTHDAQLRLLTAHPRLIPRSLRVAGILVDLPEAVREDFAFTSATLATWQRDYGFDFSPLLAARVPDSLRLRLPTADARKLPRLSASFEILNADLTGTASAHVETHQEVRPERAGVARGLLCFFEIDLADQVTLSTAPNLALDTNHWGNRIIPFAEPVAVTPGQPVVVRIERRFGLLRASCVSPDGVR